MVAIAKAAGFVISAEELKNAQQEVSEEELEGVAGGSKMGYNCIITSLGRDFGLQFN